MTSLEQKFVMNAWYCAGWDHYFHLGAENMVTRRIAGQSLLLYRTPEGKVVAMEDRCPHRSAPLSLGRKEGASIRCMYHGMMFNEHGKCIEVPGMAEIPERAVVRTFPVIERDNWIWVWMGDPAAADPNLICYSIGPSNPNWVLHTDYLRIDTDYRLEIANLADLSHVAFVHETSLGGFPDWALVKPKPSHKTLPRGIKTTYWMRNVPAAAFARHLFPDEARFDVFVEVEMSVPCNFILKFQFFEVAPADATPGKTRLILDTFSAQAVTPRDDSSIDYYFSWGTSKETWVPGLVELMKETNVRAFKEDRRILEGQLQRMREYPHVELVNIIHDAGPSRMLWVLDRLIQEESRPQLATAS